MVTDYDYRFIADDVYEIDINKATTPYQVGELVANDKFQVLEVEDNPVNGMQAMAVAPIVDGKVDTSQIVIAYVGTNFGDWKDRQTDINSVIGGQNHFEASPHLTTASQLDTAMAFSDTILARYPNANISYTGHSLGGYIALITAAENQKPATTFNAPSSLNNLSDEAITFIKDNKALYNSYRINNDYFGNLGAYFGDDELGISKRVDGKDVGLGGSVYYHGLDRYQFNDEGQLITNDGQIVSPTTTAVNGVLGGMADYYSLKTARQTEGGGLSSNETFFLDSVQATTIATGLVEATQAGTEQIEALANKAIEEAETLYQSTKSIPWYVTELTADEVQAAYAEAGVTYDSIVTKTQTHFEGKVTKATTIATTFSDLQGQIQAGIDQALAADTSLAGEFNQWSAT